MKKTILLNVILALLSVIMIIVTEMLAAEQSIDRFWYLYCMTMFISSTILFIIKVMVDTHTYKNNH